MTVYAWPSTARISVPAQVVGETIELIQKEDAQNLCTAESLVDVARDEDSPLHKAFEWDDPYAAEQYRKGQARELIRSVRVARLEDDALVVEEERQAFVSIRVETVNGPEHGYVAVTVALAREDQRQQLKQDALVQLRSLHKRYGDLLELNPVWEALNKVE